jgi:uncharacterized membrane protein YagU involved in acid resistance
MKGTLFPRTVLIAPFLGWMGFFLYIKDGFIPFILLIILCFYSFIFGIISLVVMKKYYNLNERRFCLIGVVISTISLIYIILVPLLNKLAYLSHPGK